MELPKKSGLAALLDRRREEIIQRFVERARAVGAADALSRPEIIDSLREFIQELAGRLREECVGGPPPDSTVAVRHGEHRFEQGYDLAALIRDYGALRELIWDVVLEDTEDVTVPEIRTFFKHFVSGMVEAANRYANLRDAELRKRTSEHVAFLAHELRNPIYSALLALEVLRADSSCKQARAFDALDRALKKTSQLIDDSLVTLRLRELGELHCSSVDIGQLAREVVLECEVEAARKQLHVDVIGEGRVQADVKALRSAISNLIRNAVKFSNPGGDVVVRLRSAESRLVLEVEDSCGGLPPGADKSLFDPFVQTGTDRSGFGLGLAIAKQATDAHGGQMRVHDLPGKGCVFVLELPPNPPCGDEGVPEAT